MFSQGPFHQIFSYFLSLSLYLLFLSFSLCLNLNLFFSRKNFSLFSTKLIIVRFCWCYLINLLFSSKQWTWELLDCILHQLELIFLLWLLTFVDLEISIIFQDLLITEGVSHKFACTASISDWRTYWFVWDDFFPFKVDFSFLSFYFWFAIRWWYFWDHWVFSVVRWAIGDIDWVVFLLYVWSEWQVYHWVPR